MTLPYNPTSKSLVCPESDETLFQRGVNPSEHALLAECARLAYYRAEIEQAQYDRLKAALSHVGFSELTMFVDVQTNTYAFGAVRLSDRVAILAFRGTQLDQATDLVIDTSTVFVSWPYGRGKVHKGFENAFSSVKDPISDWINNLVVPKRLLITGHSLGAALGILASSIFKPTLLLTIGSPRVGNHEFSESIKDINHARYTNCCDIVPRLPPTLLGFAHTGTRHYINKDGLVILNPVDDVINSDRLNGEISYLKNWAWRYGTAPFRAAADHSPMNYLRLFY